MLHHLGRPLCLALVLAACRGADAPADGGDDGADAQVSEDGHSDDVPGPGLDAAGPDASGDMDAATGPDAADAPHRPDGGGGGGDGDGGDGGDALAPLDVPPGGTMPAECTGGDTVVRSAGGDSRFASVVWTGTEYGVAWQDEISGSWEIHLARITASGTVLNDHAITADGASNEYPSLAWDGARYWIAWARRVSAERGDSVRVVSVTPTGPAGVTVGTPVTASAPDSSGVAWPSLVALPPAAGGGLAVAWEDGRDASNHEIYFARLDAAGRRMGPEVRVTHAPRLSARPVMTWNHRDGELGLLWLDDRDGTGAWPNEELYFTRLSPAGARVAGATDVRLTRDAVRSIWQSMAFDGAGYGVAWANEDMGSDTPLAYFMRIDASGAPGSVGPVRLSTGPTDNREYSTAVAWNGAEFLVAWQDNRHQDGDLIIRRVSRAGVPLGPEYFMADDTVASDHAALIWGNGEWMIAWEDNRDSHRDIFFRRMARDACLAP